MSYYNWEVILSKFSIKELVRIINDMSKEPTEKVDAAFIELQKRGFSTEKMTELHEAIKQENESKKIYAGLFERAIANFLDFLFLMPIIYLMYFIDNLYIYNVLFTGALLFIIAIIYNGYLVKRYSGTPGKLIMGIRIKKLNNQAIGWKEAILRSIVPLAFLMLEQVMTIISFSFANLSFYENLNWIQKLVYLQSIFPVVYLIIIWIQNLWSWSELIVLLTNDKKRALHDFIAKTIVVNEKYFKKYVVLDTENK
jgi:uncharacterized RDD family membrane protein YckC